MTHHFSCSGCEKIKKNIFRPFWPNWAPNLGQKGSFWVKIFKKMKIFQKFFFRFEWFWVEKRPKKGWKIFFLTKLVWHLVIFGQKMRILDVDEFWRFRRFLMILTMFATSIKFVNLANMIFLRFLRFFRFSGFGLLRFFIV